MSSRPHDPLVIAYDCDLLETFMIIFLCLRRGSGAKRFQCALRLHSINLDIPGIADGVHAALSCLSFVFCLLFTVLTLC